MRITGIVFLLSLIAANPASAQAGKSLDDYLSRLEALGWSGAAVVVRGDDVLLQKGYGLRDPDTGARVTTDTVFTLGSIAKPLTATAVMKLESRGALATSDPITKYFKGVPEDKKGITLHHLLTHTAGLPAALGHDFDVSLDRVGHLKLAMNSPLRTPPGDRYAYSNVGFTLLAMIVEIVSEQPFETFLRKEVLLPAGMTRTGYFAPKYKKDELCVGYRDGKRWGTIFDQAMRDDGPSWHLRGNGGIHTTIGDMLKWHRALEKNTVISKATQAKMLTPYADEGGGSHYGYGWSLVKTVRGSQLAAHNGGNPTFSADFRRYLDEGVMTFVASARSEFFVDPISHNLASIVFGHRVAWPPKVTALSAAALKALCGTYAFERRSSGIRQDRWNGSRHRGDRRCRASAAHGRRGVCERRPNRPHAGGLSELERGRHRSDARALQGRHPEGGALRGDGQDQEDARGRVRASRGHGRRRDHGRA